MRKTPTESLLQKAKTALTRWMFSSSRQRPGRGLSANGTPADPAEFHRWSVKRHADSCAKKMNISGKSSVLLPDISQLNSHLRELSISHTEISDITVLSGLPNLEKLKILASPILDFSVLASLKNLKELDISYSGDAPIRIPSLPELVSLKVYNTHGDIRLGDFPKLQRAKFQVLRNLAEVCRQPRLEALLFQKIEDPTLDALGSARSLKKLDIRIHIPLDLNPISALSKLEQLRLIAPVAVDISPLAQLTGLTKLDLSNVRDANTVALSALKNLVSLNLRLDAPLSDLSFLSDMTELKILSFCPSKTANLSVLTNLPHLQVLTLVQIDPNVRLSPLTSCQSLQTLTVMTDKSLPPARTHQKLPAPPQLTHLGLNWHGLKSLSGLEKCLNIQKLSCPGTDIESLLPLSGMKHLAQLNVAGSKVSDLSVLNTLAQFLEESPEISLAISDTPALERYPVLKKSVAMENGREGSSFRHLTALDAVRAVRGS